MPKTDLEPVYEYEALLRKASPKFEWPEFDENTLATLGYTTGTTGQPKGAHFTHRMAFPAYVDNHIARGVFNNSI